MPPTPLLTNAEHFDFTNALGERLDLYGALLSWSDTIDTGVVQKQVVKRAGAIHQRIGAPPRKFDFKCSHVGADVRDYYQRVVDVILQEPEGRLTHPWFGSKRAVCRPGVGAMTSPADAKDTIEFSIQFEETGLVDPPKPAPSAKAASSSAQGALVSSESASEDDAIAEAGAAVGTRSEGFLVAMQRAETGQGTLLDVDASLSALVTAVNDLDAASAPKSVRSKAYLCLGYALQARNSFTAGRPPLIRKRIDSPVGLSVLCQNLYGSRGLDEKALMLRLNRIARPYSIQSGTVLLMSDPSVVVTAVR